MRSRNDADLGVDFAAPLLLLEQRVALLVGEPGALGFGRERLGAGCLACAERRDRAVGQIGERRDLHDHDHRMDHDARKVRAVGKHRIGIDEIQRRDDAPRWSRRRSGSRASSTTPPRRRARRRTPCACRSGRRRRRSAARAARRRRQATRTRCSASGGRPDRAATAGWRRRTARARTPASAINDDAAHGRECADAGGQGPEQGDQHLAEGEAELEQSGAHREAPCGKVGRDQQGKADAADQRRSRGRAARPAR